MTALHTFAVLRPSHTPELSSLSILQEPECLGVFYLSAEPQAGCLNGALKGEA